MYMYNLIQFYILILKILVFFYRKKKKNKAKEVTETIEKVEDKSKAQNKTSGSRTPAQIAFAGMQAKRVSLCIHIYQELLCVFISNEKFYLVFL